MGIPKAQKNVIKPRQVWQKVDTGVLVEIASRSGSTHFVTRRIDGRGGTHSKKRTHHISVYDLLKHWRKIS